MVTEREPSRPSVPLTAAGKRVPASETDRHPVPTPLTTLRDKATLQHKTYIVRLLEPGALDEGVHPEFVWLT